MLCPPDKKSSTSCFTYGIRIQSSTVRYLGGTNNNGTVINVRTIKYIVTSQSDVKASRGRYVQVQQIVFQFGGLLSFHSFGDYIPLYILQSHCSTVLSQLESKTYFSFNIFQNKQLLLFMNDVQQPTVLEILFLSKAFAACTTYTARTSCTILCTLLAFRIVSKYSSMYEFLLS